MTVHTLVPLSQSPANEQRRSAARKVTVGLAYRTGHALQTLVILHCVQVTTIASCIYFVLAELFPRCTESIIHHQRRHLIYLKKTSNTQQEFENADGTAWQKSMH